MPAFLMASSRERAGPATLGVEIWSPLPEKPQPITSKDATDWIAFFNERNIPINVADWLQIQQFEWFIEKGNHLLSLDLKKINYYETALKYEQNIKGTV